MTPEQFIALRDVFDQVIDLAPVEREARVRALSNDPAVIDGVLSLLAANEAAASKTYSTPVNAVLTDATTVKLAVGDVLGAWRIEREIGHGGMGTVYLVERSDGHFKQTAALKFLRGLPSANRLQHFARERQLLANLQHPNIAQLLDGGATNSGQPYLVMAYVDGAPIDNHCRALDLDHTQILRLFVAACEAVAFAHRQLIVHCDLKPSNILIDKEGRPILLDFGVSRLLGATALEDDAPEASIAATPTATPTATHTITGYTPRYASPEQRETGIVSTASDVYSLGVMLGELLEQCEPNNDELNAIVAKATSTTVAMRFQSVEALVDDIARFQRREPLRAMPRKNGYVARKLFIRRWPLFVVGIAFVVTVFGFSAKIFVESQRAQHAEQVALEERDRAKLAQQQALTERDAKDAARGEALIERDRAQSAESRALKERDATEAARRDALVERDRAKTEERKAVTARERATLAETGARQTSDFLISVFDSSNPNAESGDIPASKLIAAAEARVEKDMQGQPATQAALYSTLGVVQSNMGRSKEAIANLQRAIVIERNMNRPLVLAEMLTRLDLIISAHEGAIDAEPYAREALALREKFDQPDSRELAEARAAVAYIESYLGRHKEASLLFQQSLNILEKHYPNHPATAEIYATYGGHFRLNSDFDKAAQYYLRSVQLNATLFGELHPKYLIAYAWYARSLASLRRFDEAEIAFRRALELRKKLHGAQNILVADVMVGLADLLNDADRPREALQLMYEAEPIIVLAAGKVSQKQVNLLNKISGANNFIGNYDAAVKAAAEAVGILEIIDTNGQSIAIMLGNLGSFQMRAGKLADARKSLFAAYETRLARWGDKHISVIDAQLNIADLHVRSREFEAASARLDAVRGLLPTSNPLNQINYDRLRALVMAGKGDYDSAIVALEKTEAARFKARGDKSAIAWMSMIDRAEVLAQRGTPADKQRSAALAAQIMDKISPTFDPASSVIARLQKLQRQ